MSKVTVICDRCGKQIEAWRDDTDGMTSGYYFVKVPGEGWGKYTNPGEQIVCDACMQADPRYQADYPVHVKREGEAD